METELHRGWENGEKTGPVVLAHSPTQSPEEKKASRYLVGLPIVKSSPFQCPDLSLVFMNYPCSTSPRHKSLWVNTSYRKESDVPGKT